MTHLKGEETSQLHIYRNSTINTPHRQSQICFVFNTKFSKMTISCIYKLAIFSNIFVGLVEMALISEQLWTDWPDLIDPQLNLHHLQATFLKQKEKNLRLRKKCKNKKKKWGGRPRCRGECVVAYRILVPWPKTEPMSPAAGSMES